MVSDLHFLLDIFQSLYILCEIIVSYLFFKQLVRQNCKERDTERGEPDFDTHMFWMLMRHLRRTHNRRVRELSCLYITVVYFTDRLVLVDDLYFYRYLTR